MSSELDKFVLQYTVDLKDSIRRLEDLNKKIANVNTSSDKAKEGLKKFASGAADSFAKLVPGIDAVSGAVRSMGGQFALAAAGVAVLAAGVKSVMSMRAQYNAQRLTGQDIGMSGTRLEEYQRKFVRASGGKVDREQTEGNIRRISDIATDVHKDVTGTGEMSKTLKVLGIDPTSIRKNATSTGDLMERIGSRLAEMDPDKARAASKTLGLSQDFGATMTGLAKEGTLDKVTELTDNDINKRREAEESLKEFNRLLSNANEKFKEVNNLLGERLLPVLTKVVEAFSDLADDFSNKKKPTGVEKLGSGLTTGAQNWMMDPNSRAFGAMLKQILTPLVITGAVKPEELAWIDKYVSSNSADGQKLGQDLKKPADKEEKKTADEAKTAAKKQSESNTKLAASLDEGNTRSKQYYDEFQQAINLFSGAVHSFASAIDEKQAWAAWAGEIGKASLGPARQMVSTPVGKTNYDAFFENASKQSGISVDILKRIATVESQMNPGAVSPKGAKGLMQVMPSNYKSLGITDPYDPEQSIMGGARLMQEYMRASKGDVRTALKMYHGGYDRSGWGEYTNSYPDKVLGADTAMRLSRGVKGESRENINERTVMQNVAGRLGVPLAQLQHGGVTKGDVEWSLGQIKAGTANQMSASAVESSRANIPATLRARAITDVQEQARGLAMIDKYGDRAEKASPEGGRSITVGENAININLHTSDDPAAIERAARTGVVDGLNEVVNQYADGLKY